MFLKRLPLIKPLFQFSKRSHKQAFPKFGALWFMSTLPVILTVLFAKKDIDVSINGSGFVFRFFSLFSASEQFVYAAAFLPPIIYLLFERYLEAEIENDLADRIKRSFRKVFDGYGFVLALACLTLLLTIITYTATKTNLENFQGTYFYDIAVSSSPWCYFFSLYCWYLSILDSIPDASLYISEMKDEEDNLSGQFSNRINARREVQ